MPTYEYKREDGSIFEFFQKMSDEPLTHCPTTGQAVTRIVSGGTGVLYKGEGWYVTDYKNSSKEKPKMESKDAPPTPGTKPEKTTNSAPKPEAPNSTTKSSS